MTKQDTSAETSQNSTPKPAKNASCQCAKKKSDRKILSFGRIAFFGGLCIACCAIPAGLVAVGVIGLTTGVYLRVSLEVVMVGMLLIGAASVLNGPKARCC